MKRNQNKNRNLARRLDYQLLEVRNLLATVTIGPEILGPALAPFQQERPVDLTANAHNDLVLEYLNTVDATQYLQQNGNSLNLISIQHGLASTTTHYQQIHKGLPVYGGTITVNQNAYGDVQRIFDSGIAKIQLPQERALAVSMELAEGAAMVEAGVTETFAATRGEMMWYVDETGQATRAWVLTVYGLDPVGDYLTVVDVDSNKVIMQENRISHFETGTGDVFEPNPYQTQGNGTGLSDNNDANSSALTSQLISVTLEGLDEGTGLLRGEFVDLSTLNSPGIADVDANEPTRIYEYTRDDWRFEQVVTYHSVDQMNRYFHVLGFDDDTGAANGIRDFATLANAHWDNADNSFYSTGDDAIHFGDGGVDDAEDADIVAHEYGHAIQHDQNPLWGGGEMGAMGEGFGDYLAASFYADFGNPTFQSAHAAAVGEWDATSYSSDNPPNLRRVDGNKTYPNDLVGQVHADGEIWSRALWDIRGALSGPIADQVILESHFTLSGGATMPIAAEAILLADQNINGGANAAAIRQAFVDRGILDALPDAGVVSFNKNSYTVNDTIVVSVLDSNATGPIDVTVETSAGDVETVTLTDQGNSTYTGSINTAEGAPSSGDGTIQGLLGQTLTVTYNDLDDGSGNPNTVTDTATIANIFEFPSSDTPLSIVDNTTFTSTINVASAGSIADIDVRIDASHTWDADLDVFLIGPNGTRVELFTAVGGNGNNFDNTILNNEAATSIASGSAPFAGEYRPEGDLSVLYGNSVNGLWTLEVSDTAGGDTGTLHGWALLVDVVPQTVGVLSLDSESYNIGETILISVSDANAVAPVEVVVESSSGDVETVTLADQGSGVYTASIVTASGANSSDGTLQTALGDTITVTYTDADDGNGNSSDRVVTANIMNIVQFDSTDTPINIVDNTTITSVINVPTAGTINDVDVQLDITHTYDGDLDVFLIAPDGTRIELFQDVGGSGDNFSGTILDDEASTNISAGLAPFSGSYRPAGSLGVVDGDDVLGAWTLEITDDAGQDQGSLNGWSLFVDLSLVATNPDIDLIGPGLISEGNAGTLDAMFEVELSTASSEIVTVDYATTVAGYATPATPGVDFADVSGTLTFMPGQTTKMVPVTVFGDRIIENVESFGLVLTNPTGGGIGVGVTEAQIDNDEVYLSGDRLDFGPETAPVDASSHGVALLTYDPVIGLGWLPGGNDLSAIETNRGDALLRDHARMRQGEFVVDVSGQTYDITLNLGAVNRGGDPMRVTIEGTDYNLAPAVGPNVVFSFNDVTVSDGQLNFAFNGLGLLPYFRVAGLTVVGEGGGNRPFDSGSATGGKTGLASQIVPITESGTNKDKNDEVAIRNIRETVPVTESVINDVYEDDFALTGDKNEADRQTTLKRQPDRSENNLVELLNLAGDEFLF